MKILSAKTKILLGMIFTLMICLMFAGCSNSDTTSDSRGFTDFEHIEEEYLDGYSGYRARPDDRKQHVTRGSPEQSKAHGSVCAGYQHKDHAVIYFPQDAHQLLGAVEQVVRGAGCVQQ